MYVCIYIVYKWWIFHAMIDKQHPAEKHWKNGPERRAFKSPSTKPRGVERWMMQVGAGENMAPWHTQQQSVTGNLLFLAPCQKNVRKCLTTIVHVLCSWGRVELSLAGTQNSAPVCTMPFSFLPPLESDQNPAQRIYSKRRPWNELQPTKAHQHRT